MGEVYVISDTHFYHKRIIELTNRPFKDEVEMSETILSNILKVDNEKNTLIFLGDWTWNMAAGFEIWEKIKSTKVFVKGNHDKEFLRLYGHRLNCLITPLYENKFGGKDITFSHYPMLTFNKSHFGAYNIYGHHHGNSLIREKFPGKRIDAGVESWNYSPVHIDTLLEKLRQLPDNWDMLRENR